MQHQRVEIDDVGKAERTGMAQGVRAGNRWGLRGQEDLGNGLSAIFVLEQGFNLDTGAPNDQNRSAFNRQLYLGINSDSFGTLTLGRQYNSGFLYFGSFGAFGTSYGLAGSSRTFSSAFLRYDNLIKYETPVIAGFKATIGYSRDAGIGRGDDDVKALMGGVLYSSGPLRVTANFDRISDIPDIAGTETGTLKSWYAAASWDFDIATVTLSAGQDIDGRMNNLAIGVLNQLGNYSPVPNATYIDGFKVKNYAISAKAPLASGHLLAGWSMSDSNLDVETAGGGVCQGSWNMSHAASSSL